MAEKLRIADGQEAKAELTADLLQTTPPKPSRIQRIKAGYEEWKQKRAMNRRVLTHAQAAKLRHDIMLAFIQEVRDSMQEHGVKSSRQESIMRRALETLQKRIGGV